MQALTPFLFSMLFPRSSSKNVVERVSSRHFGGDNPSESLLSHHRVNNEVTCFQEGYILQDRPRHSSQEQQQQRRSTKTRKHRSTPSTHTPHRSAVVEPSDMENNSDITRANNTFPSTRRAGPPNRLSLDHQAAFMATFPMLDGLGDTSRPKDYSKSHSRNINNTATTPTTPITTTTKTSPTSSTSSPKPKSLRKKASSQALSSRSSTSSICSMVSDTSSSSSSSLPSLPPTPTRLPNEYCSSLNNKNNNKNKNNNNNNNTKDLIILHGFGEEELCRSPKSNNFFAAEIPLLDHESHVVLAGGHSVMATTGYNKAVVVGARGQRQLIAH